MNRKTLHLITRINHGLPLGYALHDSGQPRGEPRIWAVKKGSETVKESKRLSEIATYVDSLRASVGESE